MATLKAIVFTTLFLLHLILVPLAYGADIALGTWHASGSEAWRTSFPLTSNTSLIDGASQLYYPHSGNYILASYENNIGNDKKLHIEGGIMGHIKNTIGSDSDFDYSQSNSEQYYGEFKTGGTSRFINVDIAQPISHNTELSYGYGYRINHFAMQNGSYLIWEYSSQNNKLDGLDSYYTAIYQGLHFGLKSEIPLQRKLTAIGRLSYSPLAIAQGHGWWNLRNLDFKHQAPAQMLDTDIALKWQSDQSTSVTVGYRYQQMSISKGWENLNSTITWNAATNIQEGLYVMGTTKF